MCQLGTLLVIQSQLFVYLVPNIFVCYRPILVLPPADIQVIYCELSEAEKDFYDALFKRSKVFSFSGLNVLYFY